jgi:hypothetical protein
MIKFDILKEECSEFFELSNNLPLFRVLNKKALGLERVKIRHKKIQQNPTIKALDVVFGHTDICARTLFAYGKPPENGKHLYYVFPKNGFKYIYPVKAPNLSKVVEISNDIINDENLSEIFVKYSYSDKNLLNGIIAGSEIMIYNISDFYAISVDVVDYSELMEIIA